MLCWPWPGCACCRAAACGRGGRWRPPLAGSAARGTTCRRCPRDTAPRVCGACAGMLGGACLRSAQAERQAPVCAAGTCAHALCRVCRDPNLTLPYLHMQAYGAGNLAALGPIFRRTCAFLAAHCLPLTALLLGAPRLLARLEGRDSALCAMAAAYSLRLLPCLWLEALNRCAQRAPACRRCPSWLGCLSAAPAAPRDRERHSLKPSWPPAVRHTGRVSGLHAPLFSEVVQDAGLGPGARSERRAQRGLLRARQANQPHPAGAAHHAAADVGVGGRPDAARRRELAPDPPPGLGLPRRRVGDRPGAAPPAPCQSRPCVARAAAKRGPGRHGAAVYAQNSQSGQVCMRQGCTHAIKLSQVSEAAWFQI